MHAYHPPVGTCDSCVNLFKCAMYHTLSGSSDLGCVPPAQSEGLISHSYLSPQPFCTKKIGGPKGKQVCLHSEGWSVGSLPGASYCPSL